MSPSVSAARPLELIAELADLATSTVVRREDLHAGCERGLGEAETTFRAAAARIERDYASEHSRLSSEFESTLLALGSALEKDHTAIELEFRKESERIAATYSADEAAARKTYEKGRRESLRAFETANSEAEADLDKVQRQIGGKVKKLKRAIEAADAMLAERRLKKPARDDSTSIARMEGTQEDSFDQLDTLVEGMPARLEQIDKLFLPRLLKGSGYVWTMVLLAGAAVYPLAIALGWIYGPIAAGATFLALGSVGWFVIRAKAAGQVAARYFAVVDAAAQGETAGRACLAEARSSSERRKAKLADKRDAELKVFEDEHRKRRDKNARKRDESADAVNDSFPRRLADCKHHHDVRRSIALREYPRKLRSLEQERGRNLAAVDETYRSTSAALKADREREEALLEERWKSGAARLADDLDNLRSSVNGYFPEWERIANNGWAPAKSVPPVIRLGGAAVGIDEVSKRVPSDGLVDTLGLRDILFPACCDFPARSSIFLTGRGEAKAIAEEFLQALMLRLLTALPPGKVRFTIVDPVGLGQGFSTFMHLADFNELLVTSKIWTEPSHIEHRLADLTEHIETVIQKYLRNEFASIEEYNEQAGEVAEPYRFLVIANFPAKFTDAAMQRLESIAQSGPACGVYVLASIDEDLSIPQGYDLDGLRRHASHLRWQEGRFVLEGGFEKYRLDLDQPPDQESFGRIVKVAGKLSKDAHRVEVPFASIAPKAEEYWTHDSRGGIEVALGPAGARKRQYLRLGHGTSQHVLLAGKTGSGKSTLMHVLVTNIALMYSPDEVELYLIDFKKGVEFKTYAANALPHARVIAIESEREFGLSVMQRLDAELKARGERFRSVNAQDLKGFRDATGERMPRILLIVDEFQEIFVEDDKVAQESALLLDRLVRQGRAFGIHVMLGSQTLGGEYTLSRTTLGQMAVRIALQCSEADAHLILSDDNLAARLLSRPGEAIYNDANGRVEGNNPFQVAWLSDSVRDDRLEDVLGLAKTHPIKPRPAAIVFEGNVPADVARNGSLAALASSPAWPGNQRTFRAWLGDAIAIKEPTAAVFYRQSASNVLLIGSNEEPALAVMTAMLLGLAAQHPPRENQAGTAGASFYVLDGTPPDAPHAGYLERVAGALPHSSKAADWRGAADVIGEIAALVEGRTAEGQSDAPAVYLFVFDLQRFRNLRRKEDDFGFSSSSEDQPAAPDKQLAAILRDGPTVGVQTIVWCDSVKNLNRAFDRQTLGEFGQRVLFQMSAADSSTLIDSPVAGKLGPLRAYYYNEDEELLEKFRPFGLPSAEFAAEFAEQLKSRLSGATEA